MSSCETFTNEFISFLTERLKNDSFVPSEALKKHISECKSCQELINNPRKAELFLKLNKSIKKLKEKTVIPEQPKNISPWQIWRFSYEDGKKQGFGLIRSVIKNIFDDSVFVQILPVKLNYLNSETSDKDIKILPIDTSMYLPALVEVWNEAVIDKRQLEIYFGEIGINYRSQISNYKEESYELLSDSVKFFRDFEKDKSSSYSISISDSILNSVISKIKSLKDKIDSLFDFDFESNGLMTLAAATNNPRKELEDFYNKIIVPAVDKNKDFSAELMKNSISIMYASLKEFSISLEDEYGGSLIINSKDGYLKITIDDLDKFNCKYVNCKFNA